MEGESDRQQHAEVGNRPIDAEWNGEIARRVVEKIIVLEDGENTDIGNDAGDEPDTPGLAFGTLNPQSCHVVDQDGEG